MIYQPHVRYRLYISDVSYRAGRVIMYDLGARAIASMRGDRRLVELVSERVFPPCKIHTVYKCGILQGEETPVVAAAPQAGCECCR